MSSNNAVRRSARVRNEEPDSICPAPPRRSAVTARSRDAASTAAVAPPEQAPEAPPQEAPSGTRNPGRATAAPVESGPDEDDIPLRAPAPAATGRRTGKHKRKSAAKAVTASGDGDVTAPGREPKRATLVGHARTPAATASRQRGKGHYANIMLKGKCMELFEAVTANIDDYTAVLNGQKRNSTGSKRFLSAHRLMKSISVTAPSFLPCIIRRETLSESALKTLPGPLLIQCVIDGELSDDAQETIVKAGAASSPSATSLLATELEQAERQVTYLMKRLRDHFLNLSRTERTGLSGATIQDQRNHWIAFAPIPEEWNWPQFDNFIVSVKQRLGSVAQVGRSHNTTDRNPRRSTEDLLDVSAADGVMRAPVRRSLNLDSAALSAEDVDSDANVVFDADLGAVDEAPDPFRALERRHTPGRYSRSPAEDNEDGVLPSDDEAIQDDDSSDDLNPATTTAHPSTTYAPSDRAVGRARRDVAAGRRAQLLKRTNANGSKKRRPPVHPPSKKPRDGGTAGTGSATALEDGIAHLVAVQARAMEHSTKNIADASSGAHAQTLARAETGGRSIMPAETFRRSMDILKEYKNDPSVAPDDLRAMLKAMAGCTDSEALAMVP